MTYFNRFCNWLRSVGYAFLRLLRQVAGRDSNVADERAAEAEQGHQTPPDLRLPDSVPTVKLQPSNQTAHAVEFYGSVAAEVEKVSPVEPAVTPAPEPVARDAKVNDKSGAETVEPKKNATITAPTEVARVTGKPIADQPSALKQSKATDPQRLAAPVKQQAEVKVKVERLEASPAKPKIPVKSVSEVATVPDKPVEQLATVSHPQQQPTQKASAPDKPPARIKARVERPSSVSSAEPKKVVPPAAQVSTVAGKVVARQQSAVHQPAATPSAPAQINPESGNGRVSNKRPANGRYSPGEVTDQTAQRLARLLISEIKLYHKAESEGSGNNVYDVLKDPIDKARKYYGQRLGTTAIDSMPDYFHAELIRALCAGDPSRLGPNYQSSDKTT